MKLDRLSYQPGPLLEFYQESLTRLGALCEQTWHDRLEVVADGSAAALWNSEGNLHSIELHFAPADAATARDASREVFPGSPLTFRLAEAHRPSPPPLERLLLAGNRSVPPELAVGEKLWRSQFPDTGPWQALKPFAPAFHFSLLALARCEIQAIDQHWSLHRVAVSLPGGDLDESLAREMSFAQAEADSQLTPEWPRPDPQRWRTLLQTGFELALAPELDEIRTRQEHSLRRELDRVDDYFDQYETELTERGRRSGSQGVKMKTAERLDAARVEHARRLADQVARHEIRVHPHIDALLLIAETAWLAELQVGRQRQLGSVKALFVPRLRQWRQQLDG